MSLLSSSHASSSPSAAGNRADHLRRLFALTWRYRGGCFLTLLWEVGAEALALGAFIYSGLALDVLRHRALPDTTQEPRWPLGIAPSADGPLWQILSIAAGMVLLITLLRAYARYRDRKSVV